MKLFFKNLESFWENILAIELPTRTLFWETGRNQQQSRSESDEASVSKGVSWKIVFDHCNLSSAVDIPKQNTQNISELFDIK